MQISASLAQGDHLGLQHAALWYAMYPQAQPTVIMGLTSAILSPSEITVCIACHQMPGISCLIWYVRFCYCYGERATLRLFTINSQKYFCKFVTFLFIPGFKKFHDVMNFFSFVITLGPFDLKNHTLQFYEFYLLKKFPLTFLYSFSLELSLLRY